MMGGSEEIFTRPNLGRLINEASPGKWDGVTNAVRMQDVVDDDNDNKDGARGERMMDIDDSRGEEHGRRLVDGEEHILQRCGMADVKKFAEMQLFQWVVARKSHAGNGSDSMPFTSELCLSSSSLEFPSRMDENNVMLGGSSLFGKTVKREIDHDTETHPSML
ncbi:hypothetical protein Dimus_019859 [Dionaea muscipula]